MAETAALLADEVFPDIPLRQWVISFPFPLRYLFAAHPQAMGKVLGIVYRAISTHLTHKAGLRCKEGATGAVTLIQRFGSALNLNVHFHILFLDGVYAGGSNEYPMWFCPLLNQITCSQIQWAKLPGSVPGRKLPRRRCGC